MAKRARKRFREGLEEHYVGVSEKIDGRHAGQTTYAVAATGPNAEPDAIIALVEETGEGQCRSVPLEEGQPPTRIPETRERICEASKLWFKDAKVAATMLRDMTAWTLGRGIDTVYAIYDPKNLTTSSLIVVTMGFVPLPGKTVIFPSLKEKVSGRPAAWQIAYADRQILIDANRRHENLLGPSEPVIDLDLANPRHRRGRGGR